MTKIKSKWKKEYLQNIIAMPKDCEVNRLSNPLEKWTKCMYGDFMKQMQPVNTPY